jgi:hypothetical protein
MADQSERPEPDFAEDPRRSETSDAGYPESQPDEVARDTDGPADDRDAGEATGNGRAAG